MVTRLYRAEEISSAAMIVPPPGVLHVHRALEQIRYCCPCGCGALVQLPITLAPAVPPPGRWQYLHSPDEPTLAPAIEHLEGCQSHYHLHGGRVVWVREPTTRRD